MTEDDERHQTHHRAHTSSGFCPATDYKTWCSGRAGHGGLHHAPRADGKTHYWGFDDGCPCTSTASTR